MLFFIRLSSIEYLDLYSVEYKKEGQVDDKQQES